MTAITFKVSKNFIVLAMLSIFLIGLPLLGALWANQPLAQYLEFPPLTRHVQHAPFSWLAFAMVSITGLLLLGALLSLYLPPLPLQTKSPVSFSFPWWGWLSVLLLVLFWIFAWNRFAWFKLLQSYTFTPLWLTFIVLINALTYWRSGHCLLSRQTRLFFTLFPISALFWWYFEYLNRFVENWYYLGVTEFSPLHYTVHATLAFATVLPAVISMMELLHTYPRLQQTRYARPLVLTQNKTWAWCTLGFASLGLIGIPVWPDLLYPLVWVAPFIILVVLQSLFGQSMILFYLNQGAWYVFSLSALAALVCGFFWEMWNYYSEPKWVYAVPFVHRFQIFEMPLLGYIGYLLFGWECLAVASLFGYRYPDTSLAK